MTDVGEVLRVLADPTRRAIFERLTRAETPVKQLTAGLDVSQPAVSQHLAALRRVGLVKERYEGRLTHYRAEPRGLKPLVSWLSEYQAFWVERIEKLKTLLEEADE
ncbi:MAG TPA: metalloregulator ArsR/SmtB family transcription factor [Polyangia bacterium]|nr:metalloregulator ArsR/SmtB family transcription factor [Polyangia bacterium]